MKKLSAVMILIIFSSIFLFSCGPIDPDPENLVAEPTISPTSPPLEAPASPTPIPSYKPSVEHLMMLNFEFCGNVGSAWGPSTNGFLENKCVSVPDREGKVSWVNYYTPNGWAAYWIKLDTIDLTPYDYLVFFAKAEPTEGSLQGFKIEFWGDNKQQHTIYTKSSLDVDWQKYEIALSDFECLPDENCLNWTSVEEIVFTFETERSGTAGTVYLADIFVERRISGMPIPEPTPLAPLLIADFDNGIQKTLQGGDMGVACPQDGCPSPNRIIPKFVFDEGSLRLEYAIDEWVAYWIKLQKADLTQYTRLSFDIRSERSGSPNQIKIELKRGNEIGNLYFGDITDTWQTKELSLSEFKNPGFGQVLSGWEDMDELVFTFESDTAKSGGDGIIYLDNIQFVP